MARWGGGRWNELQRSRKRARHAAILYILQMSFGFQRGEEPQRDGVEEGESLRGDLFYSPSLATPAEETDYPGK